MPFTFEGVLRRRRAIFGVYELSKSADSIIAISDDSLLTVIHKETKIADAFHIADDTIRRCVQSVSDAINISGITNIKFSELKLLLSDAGYAKMGHGSAKGASGARNAAEAVINNSLMENTVAGGNGVFLSIIGGEDINLLDETAIIDVFAELTMPDATFIWGVGIDSKMARDEIEVTAIVFNSDIAIALNREMEVMESESKERKQEFRDELMGMPRWLEKTEPDKMREQTDALMSRSDGKEVCAYLRNIPLRASLAPSLKPAPELVRNVTKKQLISVTN